MQPKPGPGWVQVPVLLLALDSAATLQAWGVWVRGGEDWGGGARGQGVRWGCKGVGREVGG